MADRAVVMATDPELTVKVLTTEMEFPAVQIYGSSYHPARGDVVVVLPFTGGQLLLGPASS